MSSQGNVYWSAENHVVVLEVTLYDAKFGVWCAISAAVIISHIFFFRDHKFTSILYLYSENRFGFNSTTIYLNPSNGVPLRLSCPDILFVNTSVLCIFQHTSGEKFSLCPVIIVSVTFTYTYVQSR